MGAPVIDITGQRFGHLVVERRAGSSAAGNATWWCRCDCGERTRSSGSDLRRGRTTSCGCGAVAATKSRHATARRALLGRTFGLLTVVEFAGLNGHQRAIYTCACKCGRTTIVAAHHLADGSTSGCGCQIGGPGRPRSNRSEAPSYKEAHRRVKFLHGSASAHACVDCGGAAQDWSYDHGDSESLTDPRGRPYSADPAHYQPRCRACHKRLDTSRERERS